MLNVMCRATDSSECLRIKRRLFEKLYPFIKAAGLRIEILTTYLPYLPGESPIELPSVTVIGRENLEQFDVVEGYATRGYEEVLEAISL